MAAFSEFLGAYIDAFPGEVARDLLVEDRESLRAFARDLPSESLSKLLLHWPATLATKVFVSLDVSKQSDLLWRLPHFLVLKFFAAVDAGDQERLLSHLPPELSGSLKASLSFPEQSLGRICEPEILVAGVSDSLQTLRKLVETNPEAFNDYLYLESEQGELKGVISFRDVFLKPVEALAKDYMKTPVLSFSASDLVESLKDESAWDLYSAVPIKTEQGSLLGIVRSSVVKKLSDRSTGGRDVSASVAAQAIGETFWVGLSGMTGLVNSLFDEEKRSR